MSSTTATVPGGGGAPSATATRGEGRATRAVAVVRRAVARWERSRAGRALAWYGAAHGSLLCGGMAYAALFALFAALAIGYTVLLAVLGNRADLRDAVLEQVDAVLPGLVGTGPRSVLSPDDLVLGSALNVASIVATLVLVGSAIAFMAALRTSVRAMFDAPTVGQSAVLARLREVGGFVLLGVAVVVTAATSIAVTSVGSALTAMFGGSVAVGLVVRGVGVLAAVVLDAAVVALVVVLVGGVRPARRDLLLGSLAAGAVTGALRVAGTSVVVGAATRNALLASFAVVVTVLLLVNAVSRVLLLVCAWMYDPPRVDDAGGPGDGPGEPRHEEDDMSSRHARSSDPDRSGHHLPSTGATGPVPHSPEAPGERTGAQPSLEERLRRGQGRGKPWSPIVRGIRKGRLPRAGS